MREPDTAVDSPSNGVSPDNDYPELDPIEIDSVPTTAADVASAGRSCLAIVALATIILLLLLLWIVFRSTSGG